jgi:hypothetical protein
MTGSLAPLAFAGTVAVAAAVLVGCRSRARR